VRLDGVVVMFIGVVRVGEVVVVTLAGRRVVVVALAGGGDMVPFIGMIVQRNGN